MKAAQARVLLTGACGGIGRAVADSLLQAGAALLLVGRSPARLAAQVH
ncbi:SDR family NAD(P)-dependent oxidoreductase, partial [Paucibacter sp. XJ19-41]